jgi:integrase
MADGMYAGIVIMTVYRPEPGEASLPRQWPLDLSSYDRSPTLRVEECAAISSALRERSSRKPLWLRPFEGDLRRLLSPIDCVLDYLETLPAARTAVKVALLRGMCNTATSFWAWNHNHWLALVGKNYREFDSRGWVTQECRSYLIAFAYVVSRFTDIHMLGQITINVLAERVFGRQAMRLAVAPVREALLSIGYADSLLIKVLPTTLSKVLLANWSPRLEHITTEVLVRVRDAFPAKTTKEAVVPLSRALRAMGVIDQEVEPRLGGRRADAQATEGVPAEWAELAGRWRDTTTLEVTSYQGLYYNLMKVGRWIGLNDPALASPAAWNYDAASRYVAALLRSKVGDHAADNRALRKKVGKPLAPRSIIQNLAAMRVFFIDCQEWGWIERRFDARRAFRTPKSIIAKVAPDPRVIDDAIWAKLLWAGLNLTEADLPKLPRRKDTTPQVSMYPIAMVKAITITWLFGALRNNEIVRLRVGCTRWQKEDIIVPDTRAIVPKDAVCWLDVPVNKTNAQYTKPTDRPVGEIIAAWEKVRPAQPAQFDPKTGEVVHYLFSVRGRRVGSSYLNERLIPLLCFKAGVPERDARGRLTSHRARATLASQLSSGKEPMSLFELQQFLGHKSPNSTQHYVRVTPTKLAARYAQAGYLDRNLRTIQVLIDRDAITSGAAAAGEPWQYYDLGHGWCTNSYFSQCVHRMACAKCAFYIPKQSARAQMIEARTNLQIMLERIPLTEEERAAIEEGASQFEQLCKRLEDIPTPAGPTPRELKRESDS